MKASPSTEWCGYAPGYFPDNVVSYSAPNPSTFVITFNKVYDPEWVLYSELSQIFPMPMAWDRTSLSAPAPTASSANLPDTTKAGAASVYKFLDKQSKDLGSWATSPLWSVVDGPMKVQSFNTDGRVRAGAQRVLVGNAEGLDLPARRAPVHERGGDLQHGQVGWPEPVTIANIPSQYAPQLSSLAAEGYDVNKAASYSFNYFPLNLNSNATTSPGGEPVRYVFRQTYFR